MLEDDPLAGNGIDVGSRIKRIAVAPQVIGPTRVDTYQENVANLVVTFSGGGTFLNFDANGSGGS